MPSRMKTRTSPWYGTPVRVATSTRSSIEDAKSLAALLLLQQGRQGGALSGRRGEAERCESEYQPRSAKRSTGSL